MNTNRLLIFCPFIALLIIISGCDIFIDYGPSFFTIQVDSISVADSVHVNDTLSMKFWGIVGTNACMHFWDLEYYQKNNQLDVTLWGMEENTYRNTNCVSETVLLENVEYRTTQLSPGAFTIVIHQKDGSRLTRTVQIKN